MMRLVLLDLEIMLNFFMIWLKNICVSEKVLPQNGFLTNLFMHT